MYKSARKLLFCFSPEVAHFLIVHGLKFAGKTKLIEKCMPNITSPSCNVMGIEFKNPVGLAAGFDKNGDCIDGLAQLGFGFIEIGTVTPVAQKGNPKPRMFRVENQDSVINRLGFNNNGINNLLNNVISSAYDGVLGINIGKNFFTPVVDAATDYIYCMKKAYPYADYLTVNLSSPNTPDLRCLQYGDSLKSLIEKLKLKQQQLAVEHDKYVPFAVKLAPDINPSQLQEIANILISYEVDGVIATNTTTDHSKIDDVRLQSENGGLSGRLLNDLSTTAIKILAAELNSKIPIIGVGGIVDGATAAEKIAAGASLVQLYTGLIYKGPSLIKEVADAVYQAKSDFI